jgi:large subunit ribosomal protein L23
VEKGFDVKVTDVHVIIMKGKPQRVRGNRIKHKPDWKKAVVTLHPDDKLDLFEGV